MSSMIMGTGFEVPLAEMYRVLANPPPDKIIATKTVLSAGDKNV